MIVVIFFPVFCSSCEVKGGDIIVKNKRNFQISVDITDVNFYPLYENKNISSNDEYKFGLSDNGTYWVRIYENYVRIPYKSVYVSGHNHVTVIIEYLNPYKNQEIYFQRKHPREVFSNSCKS